MVGICIKHHHALCMAAVALGGRSVLKSGGVRKLCAWRERKRARRRNGETISWAQIAGAVYQWKMKHLQKMLS
jgi:hypothetical protein